MDFYTTFGIIFFLLYSHPWSYWGGDKKMLEKMWWKVFKDKNHKMEKPLGTLVIFQGDESLAPLEV